ncbi:MAG: 2-C-methyl-D-erythritol 4-phosphate cytidylyltransferase [Hyphomonadaceae bacterium]|nr:MAG: 2-C-methyl-D-erythritol 4-phosphate cytidylyltransferase [Hyphomonadaceae bacterium]
MRSIAIIVAGGVGQRSGLGAPKQYASFGGKMMVKWAIDYFMLDNRFQDVILVHNEQVRAEILAALSANKGLHLVQGGETRSASCRNGLIRANEIGADFVFIHDAARPGVDSGTIDRLFVSLAEGYAGAVPAIAMADALWEIDGETKILAHGINRSNKVRVQTPQAFALPALLNAYSRLEAGAAFADDAEIAVNAGIKVAIVEGSPALDKVTFASDFARMENLICPQNTPQFRLGMGFDAHKFGDGDFVTLCGVKVPHSRGLIGHSDADVAWHALVDAILGALAEGDIGRAFPPNDNKWRGASSEIFLKFAIDRIAARGGKIANLDLTIICEEPKISPISAALVHSTAIACGIDESCVSIKATTTEQMGFTGRKEGIAAQALVNISI